MERWCRVQHIANEFLSRWGKEYLKSLQSRTKWQGRKRNFSASDVVLVLQDESVRNQWPMARVIHVFKDSNGYVGSVNLRIRQTENSDEDDRILEIQLSKVVLLAEQECVRLPSQEAMNELVQDNSVILA